MVFLKDAAAAAGAVPFLSFLNESFFLPSILVPAHTIDEVASLSAQQDSPPWVRIYATDASSFEAERALEILRAQEVFDKLLEDEAETLPEPDELPPLESLVLDPSGNICSSMKGESVLSVVELVGLSYRVNLQGAAGWRQLCERTATRWVRGGMHDRAITVWQASAKSYPSEGAPQPLLLNIALSIVPHYDLTHYLFTFAPQPDILEFHTGRER